MNVHYARTLKLVSGTKPMVSYRKTDSGDFLPPQRTIESTVDRQGWAKDVMLHYKRTGCALAKEALLIFYMETYVANSAKRVAAGLPNSIEPEDLAQSAYFALSDYIDKFNPTYGFKFESFARLRIEGAMHDYLRREDPVSRLARTRSKMIARGIAEFTKINGYPPTDEELRELLCLDQTEFIALMRDMHVPNTLSFHPTEQDNETESSLTIHIEVKNSGFAQIDRDDLHGWLYQELGHYDLLIITLTYIEGLTMLEIGHVLGYSESRVSQRLKHVHALLKTRLLDHQEIVTLMAS